MLNDQFIFPEEFRPLLKAVIENHKLNIIESGHGLTHWLRVIDIGITLAYHNNVDPNFVIAFGLLHDSARTHDQHCFEHGPAACDVINKFRDLIPLDDTQISELKTAVGFHTTAHPHPEQNISHELKCCWDSDRLDLLRVGIVPANEYLYTKQAKLPEFQEYRNEQAQYHSVPYWAQEIYFEVEEQYGK